MAIKGAYSTHKFYLDTVRHTIAKKFRNYGLKSRPDLQTTANMLMTRMQPSPMETIVMGDEYNWIHSGRVVMFPESEELLERIRQSKCDLRRARGFRMPHDCFMLAFPKDFILAGHKARGCLVTWMINAEREERLWQPFFRWAGVPPKRLPPSREYRDEHTLSIMYQWGDAAAGIPQYNRVSIPKSKVPEVLRCKTAEEFSDSLGDLSGSLRGASALDKEMRKYQFELVKLVCSLAVYMQACDDAVEEGYPGAIPRDLQPKAVGRFDCETIGTSSQVMGEGRGQHWRSFHFRQLVDERYYKGKHAHLEPGSRIVFVRGAYVGEDVEAETIRDVDPG